MITVDDNLIAKLEKLSSLKIEKYHRKTTKLFLCQQG